MLWALGGGDEVEADLGEEFPTRDVSARNGSDHVESFRTGSGGIVSVRTGSERGGSGFGFSAAVSRLAVCFKCSTTDKVRLNCCKTRIIQDS